MARPWDGLDRLSEHDALVLALVPHGETGAVVRFLDRHAGLVAAFVHGARSRRMRATLEPGNRVRLTLKPRGAGQLPSAAVELSASRALAAFVPHTAAIMGYATALTTAALPESVPHPRVWAALDLLMEALSAGADRVAALAMLARFELLLLEEAGFALDLTGCALGGPADDLGFVSPRTGRAVSRARAAGQPWASRVLPLPAFLVGGGGPDARGLADGLALTGHFLARQWLAAPRLKALRRRALEAGAEAP